MGLGAAASCGGREPEREERGHGRSGGPRGGERVFVFCFEIYKAVVEMRKLIISLPLPLAGAFVSLQFPTACIPGRKDVVSSSNRDWLERGTPKDLNHFLNKGKHKLSTVSYVFLISPHFSSIFFFHFSPLMHPDLFLFPALLPFFPFFTKTIKMEQPIKSASRYHSVWRIRKSKCHASLKDRQPSGKIQIKGLEQNSRSSWRTAHQQ